MNPFPTSFSHARVLVIGDTILDRYMWGKVWRISPEAPVPVVKVLRCTETLGGAGNVANNLAMLGCRTTLIGISGQDDAARKLNGLLSEKGVTTHLIADPARPTITKTRIMAQKQQMLRLDEEIVTAPAADVMDRIQAVVVREMSHTQVIVISDYGKGFFQDAALVREIISRASLAGIPVLVDPKGTDWRKYEGATCITPNAAELEAVAGVPLEEDEKALVAGACDVRRRFGLTHLLVTRGAQGMCLIGTGCDPIFIPAQAREVFDVSGAGDTVIATLAACMAAGMSIEQSCRVSNMAGGIVVGKLGTQPVLFSELSTAVAFSRMHNHYPYSAYKMAALDAALNKVQQWKADGATIVFTNGCFDLLHPGHVSLLYQARAMGNRLIVGLNSDASVKRLKGDGRPILGEQDRAALLSALECVDMVVYFNEDTPLELIRAIRPDILVKGSDYAVHQVAGRDIVESYGGRVELVMLIPGYSTTGLTRKIKE